MIKWRILLSDANHAHGGCQRLGSITFTHSAFFGSIQKNTLLQYKAGFRIVARLALMVISDVDLRLCRSSAGLLL